MSWKTTFDGQFGLYDAKQVDDIDPNTPFTALPAPSARLKGNAEQIMVQALETNLGTVVVSQTGLFPAGFRIAPGAAQILPDNSYGSWRLSATVAGCSVIVNYVAGPK